METWRRRAVVAVIIGLALIGEALAGPAAEVAEETRLCYPVDPLREALGQQMRLHPAGRGLNAVGNMTELWVGLDGSGWMLVVITPDGYACPLDQGPVWEMEQAQQRPAGWRP